MGKIETVAAEMRTAGLTLEDHMLYTIFIDALPAEYEVEATNLAFRDSIGRDDIIKAVREQHHSIFGNREKGSNAGHAGHTMFSKAAAVLTEKVEAAVKEKVNIGDGKDAAIKAPTRTVVARPRLPAVMAAAPKPPMVVPPK